MKPNPIPVIAALLLFTLSLAAQDESRYQLLLKSGTLTPEKNITAERLNQFSRNTNPVSGKTFAIIQFEQIPTESIKQQLKLAGIELLDYIPNNAYTVTITGSLNASFLTVVKARSVIELSSLQKMQPELALGNFPAHAVKVAGTVDVWICFPKSFSFETVANELRNRNIDIISSLFKDNHIIALRLAVQRLGELALLPFVEYVEAAPGEDQPLSQFWTNWGRDGVRATLLGAPLSVGGKNLKGSGVVVGIGEDGDPQQHVDFTKRLISRAAGGYSFHGTHVTGIVGGAGIRNELRTGFAPKSTIISQIFSNILVNAPAYVSDYGMVITNNSYGNNVSECSSFGVYDLYSRILDEQAFSLPHLQNVFAAGNSGFFTCPPMQDSFRTVLGGYQSAKNIITTGNFRPREGRIYEQSSRGPVRDGRIKPEIVAVGTFIESTVPPPFDYYWENTGTSMASPAIAGGLALLYEKYRLLHPPGLNPKNGLMKALVCNSADDWGKPGPDYTHGFGVANFARAVEMLESNHYATSAIDQGSPQTVLVNVPAGLASFKVMLYWNDPEAAVLASQTLVNDLDLEVVTPLPATILPLVLDTLPANIKNDATNGVDHINNIEQVVIKNPVAGDYTIRILPTNITQNSPQQYFIVYDFVPVETKLVAPIGGESYLHGENIIVRWDSYGDPENTFTLDYSIDNGNNWILLRNNIESNRRDYFYFTPNPSEWFVVPQVATDQALLRISRNGTGLSSTSLPFIICDTINVSLSAIQCEDYFSIDWTPVTGATGYEVMMLQGDEMLHVATVANSIFTYTFSGLSKDSVYWASVRPLIGVSNSPGRRGIAVTRKPDSGSCSGVISNDDIKLDGFVSPVSSGRKLTSTELTNSIPLTVRVKNLDDMASTSTLTFSYSINGGLTVTDPAVAPTIIAGATYDYTFLAPIDLSNVNIYNIEVTVTKTGDPVLANNTRTLVIKQLDNPLITLPFTDNMDAAPVQSFTTPQMGLQNLDRYDFVNNSIYGRIRTFINTGIAYSGNRALTLDADRYNGGNTDSLTGTYNIDFTGYNPASDEIRMDFRYKNHGQGSNTAHKVWIRGSDADSWKEIYDLFANQNPVDGSFKLTSSLEVSDILAAAPAQIFSPSFQVRWGQYGQHQAADNDGGAGYTFDDIRLYKVTDDMQMISIDAPAAASCALNATTPVTITVRNSSNTIVNNVPVSFRVDGGAFVSDELIPSIGANASVQFTFTATANLVALGAHLIEVRVTYGSDNYPENDTLSLSLVNSSIITVTNATPYLQNFESGNGSWYSAGKNSSWEYGTPASSKIKRAASGSKAWKTRITGNYNDYEKSYLYSPCYNVSTMTAPTLSFSLALDLEDCGSGLCDGAYMEYSLDGKIWDTLGAYGVGTNWYNKDFTSGIELWSVQNYSRWHVATIPLTTIPVPVVQLTELRLRLVVISDPAVNRDGVAIDDIHIYNNPNGIYDGVTMVSPVTVNIPGGADWVDFISPGGKLVASVKSPVQAMGNTDVQAYIHTGSVRINSDQFYHNRNITIKPATVNLTDSASVRFYFLDTETEALINATGCAYCYKPTMAYELGETKYSDADDSRENGTLADNLPGNYLFINAGKNTIVPFDKGYYAEFKVKDFSEFWLSNGGLNNNTPLPLRLISFNAKKKNNKDVLAEWVTASEFNVNRFEIEVAQGNSGYQQNQFSKIGQIGSQGNSTREQRYNFTDLENNKTGVRYYRLKIIDNDGSFSYSPVRPVLFANDLQWQVYPNPSAGIFYLVYQVPEGEPLTLRIFDATGKNIKQYTSIASGFLQKLAIDMQDKAFTSGIYLLEASSGLKKQAFRIIKQ
ncbi:MAG: S8 family serine peptidase [Chitinophagaceae bacterium]|nr:S8 family serine peptidase [Chitinophagaceae bacterium]